MTFDNFVKRNAMITDCLIQVARSKTPLDEGFRELLVAQDRLLNAAELVLDGARPARIDIGKRRRKPKAESPFFWRTRNAA